MKWRGNQEFFEERGDVQAPPDFSTGPSDMLRVQSATSDLSRTPLGEPKIPFDVRSTYASRPVNAYDFNMSATVSLQSIGGTTSFWTATFTVPNGYRAVPLEWEVTFDQAPNAPLELNTVTLQQGGANLPYNGPIVVGYGTTQPIKSFFVCEENTTFGIAGVVLNTVLSNVIVNVYGNLIAVSEIALPFSVANRSYAS